ncbi:DNA-processing protein DprA [Idiomarina sp.]|uniref:DNA-processing protein DprA n=1 Tax=Idiomarina sp. TaxID=1874361 RepID=UPI003A90A31B
MNLSLTAQATLLLTSYFSKASSENVKPLTNAEWGRFALWLKAKSITPADLLGAPDPQSLLYGWQDKHVSSERVINLLNRGHSLALAFEKWQRAGLWVVTRSDPEYPRRLKQRLKTDSPPVLFGCGNKSLLNSGGVAIVGSRNASNADLLFTEQVGAKAAAESVAVVSGGARGVDQAAMLGAMSSGGAVIGIMSDSLLKSATSSKWRKGLMDSHVVLVSPFYPEAGFNAGNAMARNKYIYCLADSSLVIHSGKKGGTLNGAQENLKKRWVPLWVKPTVDSEAANTSLVAKGGQWCKADIQSLKISELLSNENTATLEFREKQVDLFSMPEQTQLVEEQLSERETFLTKTAEFSYSSVKQSEPVVSIVNNDKSEKAQMQAVDFYRTFVKELYRLAASPITLEALIEATDLDKSQLNTWLKRAINENLVIKLNRPVRYQVNEKK